MPSVFSKLFKRKKSERVVLIADPPPSLSFLAAPVADGANLLVSPPTILQTADLVDSNVQASPEPLTATTDGNALQGPSPASFSPLAAPVADGPSLLVSIPQTTVDPDDSNVQASPEPSTATTGVNPLQGPSPAPTDVNPLQKDKVQITKGLQKYRAEVTNNNVAGTGAVQAYEGHQQFFAAVTNNNIASSNSHNSNYGNTNSTISGDVTTTIERAADGTERQISQRTTPNTLSPATPASTNAPESPASTDASSPPTSPTQRIEGDQVFYGAMTNNNSLASGTAQIIDGEQEFWGPVVNNNSRTVNSHNTNANNVNSNITGNNYRVVKTAQPSALARGPDVNTILANILAGQNSAPNQTRFVTNFEGQDAASSEDQLNVLLNAAVAQFLAQRSK